MAQYSKPWHIMTQHGQPWLTMVHHGPLTHYGHHCQLFFHISLFLSASAVWQLNTLIICFLQEVAPAINLNEMFPTGVPLISSEPEQPWPWPLFTFPKNRFIPHKFSDDSEQIILPFFLTLILYGESLTTYWNLWNIMLDSTSLGNTWTLTLFH